MKNYTFTAVSNQYIVDQVITVKTVGNIVVFADVRFQVAKAIPNWTSIHIATINNWIGKSAFFNCVSMQGGNEPYTQNVLVSIDNAGNMFAGTQGTVSNGGWWYTFGTYVT